VATVDSEREESRKAGSPEEPAGGKRVRPRGAKRPLAGQSNLHTGKKPGAGRSPGNLGLFLLVAALGSFERVDLLLQTLLLGLRMGCEVAGARPPLDGGVGVTGAIDPIGPFRRTLAALALFDDRVAEASIVAASRFGHEGTLRSGLYSLTNHDKHLRF